MNRVADMPMDDHLGPRLLGPMLIWLGVMLAGALAAWFAVGEINPVGKVALGLAIPALLSLLLMPMVHKTWAQIILLVLWTGFAVIATLIGGFFPIAITFLCIPAIAMLFTRERVLEALVLAALAMGVTYLSLGLVDLGESPLSESGIGFLGILGTAGALALTIAAMIAGSQNRDHAMQQDQSGLRWGDGVVGGLFEFDANDYLVRVNGEGRRQFGLEATSGEHRLTDLAIYNGARTALIDSAQSARRIGAPASARISMGDENPVASALDLYFTPIADGGLLLHALDRSDEAARLEELRRSQTVAERETREKTLFFAGVSHELRTPLNAIIGFSDMMRSRLFGPLPGKYAEYADLIHDSGQYMLDLIGDVLDLSKVEAGQYTLVRDTFDISDVVRSSVKMIRPSADAAEITVDVDLPSDDVLLINADRKAVRQMLLNLLSNAVKFSPKGSRVDVAVREDGERMVIAVSDQGPGMSKKDIARIGQPYMQGASGQESDARGSGLGLSLVRQLAELHGGHFAVHSELGEGTDARISLPAQAERD